MSGSIPPSADEHEEPDWLKVRGTVKLSPLPAVTIPILDATIPAATLAASLSNVEALSDSHANSPVIEGPLAKDVVVDGTASTSPSSASAVPQTKMTVSLETVLSDRNEPTADPQMGAVELLVKAQNDHKSSHKHSEESRDVVTAPHRPSAFAGVLQSAPVGKREPDHERANPTLEPDRTGSRPVDPSPNIDAFDVTAPADTDAAANSIAENAAAGRRSASPPSPRMATPPTMA